MVGMADLAIGSEHAAYLPRLLPGWAATSTGLAYAELDASLVMFDISGFTRLTERLSRQGRAGAEELSDVLHAVFTPLVAVAEDEGSDLLKWGGDAVLLLVDGPDHARRAARAARGMHRVLGRVGHLRTSVGPVVLRASSGIHTGTVHLVLAGDPAVHRELIVVGPAASAVCRADAAAGPGQIVVSDATARALPGQLLGAAVPAGRVLLNQPVPASASLPAGAAHAAPPELLATLLPPQLRVHLTQRESEPEHRMVAAAFLRFDGTDRLLDERGPARLAAGVDELIRNVQDSVARHGVALHESDVDVEGGKLMLLAGAPLSTGDDVDHLVSAVRLVVGRAGELPLRAGIAHGRVFTGDLGPASRRTYSVKGHAVNLAARLAARAGPGEVLAPVELFEHAHRAFDLEVRPALTLKGVARPVITVLVGDALDGDAPPATTVMVGREREVGLLTAALDRLGGPPGASGGTGAVVEIVGEPGIGKSRLVGELASRAEDFVVLTAAADRSGLFTPYGAARGLLSRALGIAGVRDRALAAARVRERVVRLAPELVDRLPLLGAVLDLDLADEEGAVGALDEQFRTEALHELVVDLLVASGSRPTVLVVEDTHLLDPASAGILTRLAAEAHRRPWLVVTTRRDDATGWRPEAAADVSIELGPLAPDSARLLADVASPDQPLPPATAEALARRAGGHPLFLRELVLATLRGENLDEPPESVEQLVGVQLDALSADDRALLRRAAVLGNTFPLRLLTQMLGEAPRATAPQDLQPALDRLDGFVVAEGRGQLAFRHAVHREVAYAGLPFRTRRALHVRAAEILEQSPNTVTSRPELLALHYFAGGRFEPAWRYARRAGERANQRFSPAAAAEAFAQAAEAARRTASVPELERARDLEALGDAQFLCGRSEAADAAYHHAGRVLGAHAPGSPGLMLKLAKVAQRQGRYRLALRRLTLGLHDLESSDDAATLAPRARLLARRSVVLMSQGRYAAAQEAASEAVDVAGRAGEADALAQAHLVLHGVHVFSGTPDLGHHGDSALRIFEELGDLGGQAHALNNLGMRRLLQGQWTESLDMFERAAGMFQRVGDAANEASASYNQADLLNRQGRYAEAAARLGRVLHVARAVGDEELVGLVLREQGRALSRDGRAAGMDLLTEARAVFADLGEPHEVTDTDIARAEAHLMAGRPAAALEAVASAVETAQAIGAVTLLPSAHRVNAAALVELGDLPAARRSLDQGLRLGSSPDLAHERGFLLVVAARAADLAGSADAATRAAEARDALSSLGVVHAPLPWLPASDGPASDRPASEGPAHG
jgi:class 3 adenylate cyclase/tetratricopeptide (TPR) repeat protein